MSTLTKAEELLTQRGKALQPTMVQMADNVHTSVNYTVSTVSMIEGENGIIIIDAGQDIADCEPIMEEFRKITSKPLLAIIYTHGHPDHTMGTPAFLPNGNNDDNKVQIWARDNFNAENKQFKDLVPIFGIRGSRQGGFRLPKEKRINNGIAPVRFPKSGSFAADKKAIPPTHTFSENKKVIKIDNIELELYAAPGETADQLYVIYKDKNILFSGDNMYRSFPNLYAVRGTAYRDIKQWINSLEAMIAHKPEKVVLGHTMPLMNRNESETFMKDFHEAVSYVYNTSIEGINKGLTIDELGEYVKLPKHLADKEYLTEFYGNVAWSAKAIFVGNLGWFDGNARKLMPLTLIEEAEKMAKLAGGKDKLLENCKNAFEAKDYKWAAQLADYCKLLDLDVINILADSIEALAREQVTATGRNYMFTYAQELRN